MVSAPYVLKTPPQQRFIGDVGDIVGRKNIRAFYMPTMGEGLVVPDAIVPNRLWTHGNTPTGRIVPLGKAASLAFNGTSDYLTTPDADDLSFGNGTVDSAFSMFFALNVTDTAGVRQIITKDDPALSQREYDFYINTTDNPNVTLIDQSAGAGVGTVGNAVITQGSQISLGVTYTAVTGGIGAGNDITVYQNGIAVAVTPNNAGTYVSLESLASAILIGATQPSAKTQFFVGLMSVVLLLQAALTAGQQATLTQRCREMGLVV